jgi:hypothetical protein
MSNDTPVAPRGQSAAPAGRGSMPPRVSLRFYGPDAGARKGAFASPELA